MALTETLHDTLLGVDELLEICTPDYRGTVSSELRARMVAAFAELARCYLRMRAPSKRALTELSLNDYSDIELLNKLSAVRRQCLL